MCAINAAWIGAATTAHIQAGSIKTSDQGPGTGAEEMAKATQAHWIYGILTMNKSRKLHEHTSLSPFRLICKDCTWCSQSDCLSIPTISIHIPQSMFFPDDQQTWPWPKPCQPWPGLEYLRPGKYQGLTANYLSYATETASPSFIPRAREFEDQNDLNREGSLQILFRLHQKTAGFRLSEIYGKKQDKEGRVLVLPIHRKLSTFHISLYITGYRVFVNTCDIIKITLLRVIPTMTFIHFLTGKSSGILSDISSGILSGILSGISSGVSSGISSGILSGKSSDILSGISSGILSDILSGISSDMFSGILSGISSDILSDISSDILSGISSDILSGISSDILSDILSGILSGISSDILSDIFSHILPVEVRQCPLRSGSRGWGPAVPTAIWKSRLRSGSAHCDLEVAVEVRQCPLRSATRGWDPAVPTGIWSSRWRSGCAHWDLDCEEEAAGEEAEEAEEAEEEEENSTDKI